MSHFKNMKFFKKLTVKYLYFIIIILFCCCKDNVDSEKENHESDSLITIIKKNVIYKPPFLEYDLYKSLQYFDTKKIKNNRELVIRFKGNIDFKENSNGLINLGNVNLKINIKSKKNSFSKEYDLYELHKTQTIFKEHYVKLEYFGILDTINISNSGDYEFSLFLDKPENTDVMMAKVIMEDITPLR